MIDLPYLNINFIHICIFHWKKLFLNFFLTNIYSKEVGILWLMAFYPGNLFCKAQLVCLEITTFAVMDRVML